MEEVTLDNQKYVKAADIAKHLGYTSDYVGQLCRSGKVDAKLVGRSWFVSEDSLRGHKQDRTRSNKAKSHAAVKQYQAARANAVHAPRPTSTSRERHISVHHYESDTSDLFPQTKRHHEAVPSPAPEPAATPIKIIKKSKPRHFKAGERPEIKFKGSVAVAQAPNERVIDPVQSAPVPKPEPQIHHKAVTTKADKATRHVVTHSADVMSSVPVHYTATSTRRRKGGKFRGLVQFVLSIAFMSAVVFTAATATVVQMAGEGEVVTQYTLDIPAAVHFIELKI